MTASLYHGPEECPLDKVPAQIEQRNTGVTLASGPCRLQCADSAGMKASLAFSITTESDVLRNISCIRAEMHIWDTPEASMMLTCPSLVSTGL